MESEWGPHEDGLCGPEQRETELGAAGDRSIDPATVACLIPEQSMLYTQQQQGRVQDSELRRSALLSSMEGEAFSAFARVARSRANGAALHEAKKVE